MGVIKKVETTKIRISNATRHMFYEHGYSNTKINMIIEATDISRTLFNYHFSSKEDLLISVMKDFLDEIYSFVDQKITDDYLMKYFVFYDIYYRKWTEDEKMSTFLIEVLNRNNRVLATYKNFNVIFEGLVKQFKLPINNRELLFKEISIFGANKEFISNYLRGVIKIDFEEFIENITSNGCKLLGIPNIIINDYLTKYSIIGSQLDHSHIRFDREMPHGK